MCFPMMKLENFSQAHVVARASFSICAYRRSVSFMVLEAYAMGFQVPSTCWSKTAPSPYDDASAEIFVGAFGSYSASVVGLESSSFTCWNAVDCKSRLLTWTGVDGA